MAVFAYKAVDADGKFVQGSVVAESPRMARDELRDRGLKIQAVTPRRGTSESSSRPGIFQAVLARTYRVKVVEFIRELSTLLGVGTPLLESLDTIIKQHRGGFRASLLALRDRVSSGASLAEAMGEEPLLFDNMSISIVRVGENAGTLEVALDRLADFKERWQQLKGRVLTALLYPAIVLMIGLAVGVFLMTYVVPNILSALVDAGRDLPWVTQVVKAISDVLLGYGWLILFGTITAFGLLRWVLGTDRGKHAWHLWQLKVPILGELIRKQAIVRIAVVMSTLLRSGVVFIQAIQIARTTTRNVIIQDALKKCEEAIFAGREISEALEQTGAFPPLVVQVFSVGQQSGKLEEMLSRLAVDYDRQVQSMASRLTAILEPVLIILLAVFVGMIAAATVLPILETSHVL